MIWKREDVIQNIKDCGQSLIDNAEKIAADYEHRCSGMTITCYVDEENRAPFISVNIDFVPENFVKRMQ